MKSNKQFVAFIKTLNKTTQEHEYKSRFSSSGLPYCPILDLQAWGKNTEMDYDMDFYTSIGTSYHSLAQRALVRSPMGKGLWGNWIIPWKLDKKGNYVEKKNCFRPKSKVINGIKQWPIYNEVDLKWGLLTGHADLVWQDEDGLWHLGDFKTTTHFIHEGGAKIGSFYPQKKHLIQLKSYALMLKRFKGIKISQYHLIYVSRNKATENNKKTLCLKVLTFKGNLRGVKQHMNQAVKGRQAVLDYLKGAGTLKEIYKHRPCKEPDDYYRVMECHFYGGERCEFHKSGKCYDPNSMIKQMKKWKRNIGDIKI